MLTITIATLLLRRTKPPVNKNNSKILDLSDSNDEIFRLIKEYSESLQIDKS